MILYTFLLYVVGDAASKKPRTVAKQDCKTEELKRMLVADNLMFTITIHF